MEIARTANQEVPYEGLKLSKLFQPITAPLIHLIEAPWSLLECLGLLTSSLMANLGETCVGITLDRELRKLKKSATFCCVDWEPYLTQ